MATQTVKTYLGSKNAGFNPCSGANATTATSLQATTITISVLVLITLSFMSQRKRLFPNLFWGLPGVVVPVNLLAYTPRRLITMLIFGMMSGDILKFFFRYEDFIIFPHVSNCYAQTFLRTVVSPLLLIAYISVKFFPLLACVGVVIPVVGPVLGITYSFLLISHDVYNDVFGIYCNLPENSKEMLAIFLAVRAPLYVTSLIIFVWFVCKLFTSVALVCTKGFYDSMLLNCKEASGYLYYTSCVKHILRRRTLDDSLLVSRDTLTYDIVAALFPFWFSPRRLPLKFMGAFLIAIFMIYQFAILFFGIFLKNLVDGVSLIKENQERITEELGSLTHTDGQKAYKMLLEFQHGLIVVVPGSPLAAMIFCFVLLYHLYITVYKNIEETARGHYKFIRVWPTLQLCYAWRYPGYQIAFAFTAFIIYTFWLWLLGLLGLLLYFALQYYTKESLCTLAYLIIPVLWVLVMVLIQAILAKAIFIKNREGQFIVLTNQRVYHWISYFLFIYDAISGLLTAILRAFLTQVFCLLLMIRLDRVVLMKGFEVCDVGYKAYMGFLHFNHIYNNSVVHSFLFLLSTKHLYNSTPLLPEFWSFKPVTQYEHFPDDTRFSAPPVCSARARNRWFVAYTLVRNPSLVPLTARNIIRLKRRTERERRAQ